MQDLQTGLLVFSQPSKILARCVAYARCHPSLHRLDDALSQEQIPFILRSRSLLERVANCDSAGMMSANHHSLFAKLCSDERDLTQVCRHDFRLKCDHLKLVMSG